ncbi:MAG: NAD(P)/FAD-dependent oxidoreductase [Bacteroidota bacterium]
MLQYSKLSFWEKNEYFSDISFCIIGAGIVGYSTAIELKEQYPDKKIVIVERGYLPAGASTKNAGFTCFGSGSELLDDLKSLAPSAVVELVRLRYRGLQTLIERCGAEQIDYFPHGSHELFTATESGSRLYEQVLHQIDELNEIVYAATGIRENFEKGRNSFGFKNTEGLIFSRGEGQINTGKMMTRLHQIAVEKGIHVLFGTTFKSYEQISDREVQISTEYGQFQSEQLIFATNGLSKALLPELQLDPARGQVLITKPIRELPVKGTFHYDSGYYYFRNIDQRLLIGGGRNIDIEGETTTTFDTTREIQDQLEALLNKVILPDTPFEIEHAWSGIMGIGANRMPVIRSLRRNVHIGVRLGGMGVALGSQIAKLLVEQVNLQSSRSKE